MPTKTNGKQIFSLYEVTSSIKKTIAARYKDAYWVKAEINKLNFYKQSGHCYPDLVEKKDGKVIAQVRANLWKNDYRRIDAVFQRTINEPLKDGIKVLLQASIGFHPEYGLALRIHDVDPEYTLGDLEREKQESIKKLKAEGIFRNNKILEMPLLPQRIAVISVQTSKGYADYLQVLESAEKSWGYAFFHMLFPSLLQSDKAVHSILNQLNVIRQVVHHFDVVAIVRGGGGDVGLACYNSYQLAREIALFPIPVITGIGHATNETVTEMVAYENSITPSKLAAYLIQRFHNYSVPVHEAEEKIVSFARQLIGDERKRFQGELKLFRSATRHTLLQHRQSFEAISQKITGGTAIFCSNQRQVLVQLGRSFKKDTSYFLTQMNLRLDQYKNQILWGSGIFVGNHRKELQSLDKNIQNMSPENVLKRGYSITLINDKAITGHQEAKQGDQLKTILYDGSIASKVQSTSKPE